MRRWQTAIAALMAMTVSTRAGAGPPNVPPQPDTPQAVLARIDAKWGKNSAAAKDARQVLAAAPRALSHWLDTPIGPVAVLEGAALLVITPSGKPSWWIGNPTSETPTTTPPGEPVAGADDERLTLARPDDATSRFAAAKPWPHIPVSPSRKGRVDLAFVFEWPLDRVHGLKLVPVTKDAVLWAERSEPAWSLVDLDGNGKADRVRREFLNFAPCIMNICDAVWFEVDMAEADGRFRPATPALAAAVYQRLAKETQAALTAAAASGDCAEIRNESLTLYHYALLGGVDVTAVRALVDQLAKLPAVLECQKCGSYSDEPTPDEAHDRDACGNASKVLACLRVAEPLTAARVEMCAK